MTRGRLAAGVLLAWTLFGATYVRALEPHRLLSQFRVRTWGSADGLPSMSISAMAQTPDGYLWVGTTEGLARFDGNRFVVFDRWNTPAFQLNEIRTLFVDRAGSLWIGFADTGLLRRTGDSFERVPSPVASVGWIGESDRGLWVSGLEGLALLDGDSARSIPLEGKDRRVFSAVVDGEGWLWVSSFDGTVLRERPALEFEVVRTSGGRGRDYETTRLVRNSRGEVRLVAEGGVWSFTDGTPRLERELPPDLWQASRVVVDSAGSQWLGLYPSGATVRLTAAGAERFAPDHPISTGHFFPLFEDREGSLWLGSWTQGLMRLTDGPFASWGRAEGLSSDAARTLLEDRDGAIWVGTTDGLNRLSAGTVTQFRRPQPPGETAAANWIYSLAQGRQGRLWVGSQAGLAELRAGSLRRADGPSAALADGIFSLLAARDERLWIGTTPQTAAAERRSLLVADEAGVRSVAIPADIVFDLLEDRRGSIWAAAKGGLFEVHRDGSVRRHDTPVAPLHQLFMSATEDSRGDLWFGTLEGGIVRYRNGQFRLLRRQDGLFDDTAWAILDDGLGYLWVTCARGIYRMALVDLDAFLSGARPQVRYRLFGVEDGLASATFEGGNGDAGIRAGDGRLWFASMKGAAVVAPAAIAPLPAVATFIEELRVDGRRVAADAPVNLSPGDYRLEIEYTATYLRAPSRVRFRYRLAGVDRDWIEAGGRRLAEYPAVPAGAHRFFVEASLDGQTWGQAATLAVTVAAPVWKRPWFFGVLGLALVALGLGVQRARVAQLRRRAGELEGMVDFSRSVAGVLEPEEIGRQLERALVARWGEAPRLVLAEREGRAAQRRESQLESELLLDSESVAALFTDWRRPLRLAAAMMDAGNTAGPLGALYRAGLLLAAPLVSGETAFGLLAVGGERARAAQESDLAHLSALAAQAAMALEGAWQAQEATRWRHVSEARGEWLQLDLAARLVFAAVARQGFAGAVTDGDVRDALATVFSDSPAAMGRIDAAIARLVAERILSRGEPSEASTSELRVERDRWLLLPEIRLPLAEILRQSAQKIGAYQLIERIGAGGMGEVYRAVNVHDGSPAAVKILFPEQTADPTARKRLEGEGEIVAALEHPGIVRLLERGEHAGRLYLAMELLPGDTLAQRLTRGKLSERRALQMGTQIASALAALHAHGVIHRDVTAGNIMCLPSGRFVLLDFGLARGVARTTLTEAATMVGTLPYMAPEILRSEAVDEASDLWSLGVVLFEALVGHLPWGEGQPTLQMALAIARLDTSPEVLERAPLRTGVAELLGELLHPDTHKRLRDAATVAERLAALALDANAASGEVALHIG